MLLTLFLIGNIGSTELVLLLLLPLLLLLVLIRRLFRSSKPTVIVQSSASPSVADELRKLQELREQGVLTAAEFEEQKRRLLR